MGPTEGALVKIAYRERKDTVMKREFLEAIEVNGVKLTKEVIDSIMDENGKDIQAGKDALATKEQQLATLTAERDGLKTQIADRDKDIKTLREQAGNSEALNTKLTELQSKYDKDTADLQKKIADQTLDHATEKFFSQFEFASELAKKAAVADFKAQGFKLDEKGDFTGGKDWVEALKKSDPAAFKAEADPNRDGQGNGGNGGAGGAGGAGFGNLPYFVAPTGTGNNGGGNNGGANPFNFGFAGVRSAPSETK